MNSCLDENGIAQFAENLNGDNTEPAPEIREHVESCEKCKMEILEISEIISLDMD